MGLLARIETLYLNILRGVILVAATAVLVSAIGLGLNSAILFASGAAPTTASTPEDLGDVTLGSFVRERGRDLALAPTAGAAAPARRTTPPDLRAAAANLRSYFAKRLHLEAEPASVEQAISGVAADVPDRYEASYAASLKALTQQLLSSTGRPLSGDQTGALLDWHVDKFKAAAEREEKRRAENLQEASARLMTAIYAMSIFLAFIFAFILVKIERNLRWIARLPGVANDAPAN